ncbi:MAG TPA: hypothetical protein VL131_12690, partial [Gammaproteobacteria bacterium]|nr:hypothetical protein [Gammaproteobacteria bacterium]
MVVSTETAGLGNRIKSWVSAMRLGDDARVRWPRNKNMPAEFAELFANDSAVADVPAGAVEYCSWRLAVLPEDEAFLPAGFATVGAGAHPLLRGAGKAWWNLTGRRSDRYRYMLFPKQHSRRSARADARHIDLEYGRIPQHFRDAYVPLFRSIAPHPWIAARVADFGARLDDDVIGVQIRTWRDDPRRYRKYHLPAVRRLAKLLDAAPARSRFLVVSDADEIVAELAAAYGATRVLHFPRTTPRRDSWRAPEGTREDLIDMLLLARTRRLFASYLSTFSEAAWWLGGANADVDVF